MPDPDPPLLNYDPVLKRAQTAMTVGDACSAYSWPAAAVFALMIAVVGLFDLRQSRSMLVIPIWLWACGVLVLPIGYMLLSCLGVCLGFWDPEYIAAAKPRAFRIAGAASPLLFVPLLFVGHRLPSDGLARAFVLLGCPVLVAYLTTAVALRRRHRDA